MIKKLTILTIALSILAIAGFSAKKGLVKGKVAFAKGDSKLIRMGQSIKLSAGTNVLENDTITTSKNGMVVVKFVTGHKLKIKPNSTVSMNLIKNKKNRTGIHVHNGGVVAKVKKLGRKGFNVDTPSAVAGVRGTTFYVESSKKTGLNRIAVNSGEVVVSANNSKQSVGANKGVEFTKNEKVAEPQEHEWVKSINWNFEPTAWDKEVKKSKLDYGKMDKFNTK